MHTAWTFATVNHQDEGLFIAVAGAVDRRVSELQQQELAKTAWAFATLNHRGGKLFTAVARVAY